MACFPALMKAAAAAAGRNKGVLRSVRTADTDTSRVGCCCVLLSAVKTCSLDLLYSPRFSWRIQGKERLGERNAKCERS